MKHPSSARPSPHKVAKASVMIATPIYRQPNARFTVALAETVHALASRGLGGQFICQQGNLIGNARNALAGAFLASDATHLMWIDDDMFWSSVDVLCLLEKDLPFAAGVYRTRRVGHHNAATEAWLWQPATERDAIVEHPSMKLFEASYVAGGFVMLKREVFKALMMAHPDWKGASRNGNHEWQFYAAANDLGEDVKFCRDWRATGGKIYVDPTIWLGHVGDFVFGGRVLESLGAAKRSTITRDGVA